MAERLTPTDTAAFFEKSPNGKALLVAFGVVTENSTPSASVINKTVNYLPSGSKMTTELNSPTAIVDGIPVVRGRQREDMAVVLAATEHRSSFMITKTPPDANPGERVDPITVVQIISSNFSTRVSAPNTEAERADEDAGVLRALIYLSLRDIVRENPNKF